MVDEINWAPLPEPVPVSQAESGALPIMRHFSWDDTNASQSGISLRSIPFPPNAYESSITLTASATRADIWTKWATALGAFHFIGSNDVSRGFIADTEWRVGEAGWLGWLIVMGIDSAGTDGARIAMRGGNAGTYEDWHQAVVGDDYRLFHQTNDADSATVILRAESDTGDVVLPQGVLATAETTTPTAVAGEARWYSKSDNMAYFQDGAGSEHQLFGAGGGSMNDLVDDLTPQLGGDLDLNSKNLDFPSTPNISDVKDEDNMASDSATMLATQQSIKAYVDTFVAGDLTIRYVEITGNDTTGDGLSKATAFATGKKAYDDLPAKGGTTDYRIGRIEYGIGRFVEPIWPIGKLGDNLRIIGQGTGYNDQALGTTIAVSDVAANTGKPFLDRGNDSGDDVWNHHALLRDFTVDGGYTGSTNLTTAYDGLVQYRSPGFGCKIDNVIFGNANAFGVHVAGWAECLEMFTVGCSKLQKGFLHVPDDEIEISGGHGPQQILISGAQFDFSASTPTGYRFIVLDAQGSSEHKNFTLINCSVEGGGNAAVEAVIEHNPVANKGWNITVIGQIGFESTFANRRIVRELDNSGGGCDVAMVNSRFGSAGDVFESLKHSVTSGVSHCIIGGYKAGDAAWVDMFGTQQVYTPTNVSTDRAYDADTVVVAELADVVGTLISDLQAKGVIV